MILNDKQRKLVEDNHNLIYFYAKKYNVSLDEYYDTLALALCYAASNYDSSKGTFSTLAIKTMHFKIQNDYTHNTRKKSIPIDKVVHYENTWAMGDLVVSNVSPEVQVIKKQYNHEMINKMLDLLDDKRDKQILYYKLNDLTLTEIGKKLNLTHQSVSRLLKNIRIKIKDADIFN